MLQWEGGGAEVSDCRIYIEKKKKKIRFLRLLMPYNIKNSTGGGAEVSDCRIYIEKKEKEDKVS